ncbi:MAG: hypothetical protein IKT98_05975 [Selenomonadaceae bacterium]|nr:hypothetical protein [Selenomonadaceae bacterium]
MPDELKEILQRELEELKQNKIRVIALVVCFIILLIIWITDDNSDGEEITLNEPPPVTKDLPMKTLPTDKNPDGIKVVMGANADRLFISDPFEFEEEPKPKPPTPTPPLPKIPAPSTVIEPKPEPIIEQPKEQIILTGTAISGENKTAMFLRGNETLFLTIGEEIDGRKISDITPDFVTFDNGERIYFQKVVN